MEQLMNIAFWAYMITSLLVVVTFMYQLVDLNPAEVSVGFVEGVRKIAFFAECLLIFLTILFVKIIADRWDTIEYAPVLASGVIHMFMTTGMAIVGIFVFLRRSSRKRRMRSQAPVIGSISS